MLLIKNLFVTQSFLESEKYERVLELIKKEKMKVPIFVEEFFDEEFIRIIIGGHTRTRYDLGQTTIECNLLYSDKRYKLNLLKIAKN